MGKSYKLINKEKGIGISYIPKKPNGVAIILNRPGDNSNLLENNNRWFKELLDGLNKGNMSRYRNRFYEMLLKVGVEKEKKYENQIKNIYFANINYGVPLKTKKAEKKNCIQDIITWIKNDSLCKGTNLRYVFVIKNGFETIKTGRVNEGIRYANGKTLEMFEEEDVMIYSVYSPDRSSRIINEKRKVGSK